MKSALDFLVETLAENGILHSSDIEQAKAMFKQQIIDAWEDVGADVFDWLKKMDYDFLVEEINKSE